MYIMFKNIMHYYNISPMRAESTFILFNMVFPNPGNMKPIRYLPDLPLNECIQATTHVSKMKKNWRVTDLFPQIARAILALM